MFSFTASREQRSEILALAYRIADISYLKERYGENEAEHELRESRKTLEECIFPRLDALGVPFWVQNSVIASAGAWRDYKSGRMHDTLKSKKIFL